ncbi:thioesterase family protein [Aspergillus aculeatinus CBS 121060]|uniref:Uncharacterized protein n=1 Tax=Aspergillus aculeatinus CBS 121060 TaxID=1448322 RepID=A0ACD1HAK7_9EURO|nr:hypothetical protein BO66DRAFT_322396 [Aspergillus aculeatinus CBS 121060]RAH70434.1 hypothetical protein BO66DRAFT_322396 [Aspergillus aculeatinus CBS 121060]
MSLANGFDTFERAIQVQAMRPGAYLADLRWEWSVGNVPNGGYVAAIFYRVAATHLLATQPNRHHGCARPIAMQLSYFHRCQTGPATLLVDNIKLGTRISVIHVTLIQADRPSVAGYVTISDRVSETGISVPGDWSVGSRVCKGSIQMASSPPSHTGDNMWKQVVVSNPAFRRASTKVELYQSCAGSGRADTPQQPGVGQWARLRPDSQQESGSSTSWTMESVSFLCDILPTALGPLEHWVNQKYNSGETVAGAPGPVWFPTLALNIDYKRCAGADLGEWLYSHIHMKSVHNGRFDVEVVIVDVVGNLVAIATQVALIMPSERNTTRKDRRG